MLAIFDQAALAAVLRQFEHYKQIRSDIHVRVVNLTIMDKLREIRQVHLNTLVRTEGVVTRRTSVFPQLKQVSYQCPRCPQVIGPFYQNLRSELRAPAECPQCQHRGSFSIASDLTIYRNYQKLTLQESPGTVPPGRLPRTKEVILLHDLIDSARPGELIDLTGIYRNNFDSSLNHLHGFPVFATVIEANAIVKREDAFASFRLTEQDEREILRLAKDPHLEEKIIKSIAPSIFGHEDIKTGIALALFGSDEAIHPNTHHRMRGDMNILILGDPGTAKSQFLKYAQTAVAL
jgi:DNA replication licensing factor MCM2